MLEFKKSSQIERLRTVSITISVTIEQLDYIESYAMTHGHSRSKAVQLLVKRGIDSLMLEAKEE